MEITEIFKALGDNTRVRIVNLLLKSGTLCSCNIESILEITQVNSSRHLAKLKSAGILKGEKRAQWVHYSISEEFIEKYPFINLVFSKPLNEKELEKDNERLEEYLRQKIKCGG